MSTASLSRHAIASPAADLPHRIITAASTVGDWLVRVARVRSQRLSLGELDSRLLADIGVSAAAADAEAARGLLDLPLAHRR